MLGVSLSLLLLAAPEDAAERLRVAWASQYEWREDGIENATLDFRYRSGWQSREHEDQHWEVEGRAQIVVVGREIVRSHFPGGAGRRGQLEGHLKWILGRFVRAPFEEEFKDMRFEGPEPTADGLVRITVAGEKARHHYVLDGDRLVGEEWLQGSSEGPGFNRQRYTVGDLGGGYVILGEEVAWNLGERGTATTTRKLTTGSSDRYPYPAKYRYALDTRQALLTVEIEFDPPTVNAEHPVVGDVAARDLLQAAWGRRYTLPEGLRIQAEFQRRIDKELDQCYWYQTVKGTLQVWGMERIQFLLDEGVIHNPDATSLLKQRLEEHFRWLVWLLRERAFADEFEKCGFALTQDGDAAVVQILGHDRVLAYRVEKGQIAGYLDSAGAGDRWWRFRLKKVKGDLGRIDGLSVTIDGRRLDLAIHYRRKGGIEVPVDFEAVGWGFGDKGERFGVAKYLFKAIKVTKAP